MRFLIPIIFFVGISSASAQYLKMPDSCSLVGLFFLDRTEMSQEINTERQPTPTIRWSEYEFYVNDTLSISESFSFKRVFNFQGYFGQTVSGQFLVQQSSEFSLLVSKGSIYTMNILYVEDVTPYQLILIERFKSRYIRRFFRRKT